MIEVASRSFRCHGTAQVHPPGGVSPSPGHGEPIINPELRRLASTRQAFRPRGRVKIEEALASLSIRLSLTRIW